MDGLIAAALTHRFFKGNVECVPVRYNEAPPLKLVRDKHVYLVDFTYPPEELLPHLDTMKSLNVIDHHDDAMKPWRQLDWNNDTALEKLYVKFDNKKSGAMLVWDFFFGNGASTIEETQPPLLVRYAQAYDLWTKELAMTDEVQSALRYSFPPHKAQLEELADFLCTATHDAIEKLKAIGSIIVSQEQNIAESLIKRNLYFTNFLDYEGIPVCFMPAEFVNMAGEIIYTRYPEVPFVVLFEDNYARQSRKYSFRSRRDGGANVSQIAARIGGKGHENSSGATVDLALVFEQLEIPQKEEQQ
jgi:oligoribonuclease NrnB/cAMP/cGMP phosphodiesterase (DHH superfamily)